MAGYSSVKMYNNFEDAWNYLNHQIEERGILDQRLVHIDEAEKERIRKKRQDFRIKNSVVTLLVIARGKAVPFVPNAVTSREGLNHAIRQLKIMCQHGKSEIYELDVFWTPKDRLSSEEIRQVYPHFKDLKPVHRR